ncbi:J domain-containing protein [Novosphingobium album (ex Hu et al. 2023)]|uniref:J domain-containing protein n=1 Tax=Novosphingobium album (ex Hu et al. 2023) TaxID=2930093 RepID=A0ABT0B3A2_9SPHN|nr:J domain-containing protein [Novosphingobium album (ex Hu et al. 2023)]MCJ2179379.1 J domain-containing protein [Novosphingobium album (ex Hu et al. 2023)]
MSDPTMASSDPFIDYYDILQVDPNCTSKALETAYHGLAKKYHPDHADVPDVVKFTAVIGAYKVLKNPEERATYNLVYTQVTGFVFSSSDDEKAPLSDAEAHEKILLFLYKRRREQAHDAGVGRYYVHEILNCPDELFEFHVWYLREKGFIATAEDGTLAITIEGVDHVIAMSRTNLKEKLRLIQSSDDPEPGIS